MATFQENVHEKKFFLKFVTYWLAHFNAWNVLACDDIQTTTVRFVSADTIVALISKDWGTRLDFF